MWARKEYMFLIVSSIITLALSANSPATTSSNGSNRQAGATGILSVISSMIPGAIGNVIPMVLLFGLGALMVPALGLGLLLREGRRSSFSPLSEPLSAYYQYRSFPSFKINTSALIDGASDVFERVMKALDNVDKKYN